MGGGGDQLSPCSRYLVSIQISRNDKLLLKNTFNFAIETLMIRWVSCIRHPLSPKSHQQAFKAIHDSTRNKKAYGSTTLRDPARELTAGIGLKREPQNKLLQKCKNIYKKCGMALSLREPGAAARIILGKLLPYPPVKQWMKTQRQGTKVQEKNKWV